MTSGPLHIGFIAQGWSPDVGGIESHTEDLVRCLTQAGHRVSALALDYSGKEEPYGVSTKQLEASHVTRMSYGYHDHDHLARMVRNRHAEAVVEEWVRTRGVDLVHVHHLTGFGLGVLPLLKGLGIPSLMTLHDYWPLCPRGQMLRYSKDALAGQVCGGLNPETCGACSAATFPHLMPSQGSSMLGPWDGPAQRDLEAELDPIGPSGTELEALSGPERDTLVAGHRTAYAIECLKHADLLLTPSERTRAIYREICAPLGLDGAQIRILENGVNTLALKDEVAKLRGQRRASDGKLVLGIVGSVLPSKGVLEVGQAFADGQQAKRFGGRLRLEIHGNLPPYHGQTGYADALVALAAATPDLEVVGPFAHGGLAGVLAGLDAVAAPSRWEEVFGLTVREARAAGLAVLVSDVGDLPAVTHGGRAGLVVEPPHGAGGVAAWGDALQQLVEGDELRKAWASYPSVPQSAEAMAAELEKLFFEVLA